MALVLEGRLGNPGSYWTSYVTPSSHIQKHTLKRRRISDSLVLVYIAPAVPTGVNTPNIWTKLYHFAYNATDKKWADDYFQKDATKTKGHHFITIPDIPAGDYIIRCKRLFLRRYEEC